MINVMNFSVFQENLDTIYFVDVISFGGYPISITMLHSGVKKTVSVMLVDKYKVLLPRLLPLLGHFNVIISCTLFICS